MAGSTLNPPGEQAPGTGIGHGTDALGPSDSSDTGSDTVGARRYAFDTDDPLDAHALVQGPEELASDTDRSGSGERASADGDGNLIPDADIMPDSQISRAGDVGEFSLAEELGLVDPTEDENEEDIEDGDISDDASV